MAPRLNGDHS
jgi:hypothetical protein